MVNKKLLTKEQALQKLRHYCGYQERCHAEVKEKGYALGLKKTEVEELTSKLIEEGYLNEERYAKLFAGGKFRIKQWGRVKIKNELSQRRVSDYCIRKALGEIQEDEYLQILHKLAKKKWSSIKGIGNQFIEMTKTRDFLLQRGFEPGLIGETLKKIATKK